MKRTPYEWPAPDADDKVYWRSLDQIADKPEFRAFVQREFPEGASELKGAVNRRSFMTLMGSSLALAGLAACRRPEEKILPYVKAPSPEDLVLGLPNYYATAMSLGTGVVGLLVESNEGRPTKIEGNPKHPATGGKSSIHAQAAILELYDPDRSTGPLMAGSDQDALPAAAPTHDAHGGHGEAPAPVARFFAELDIESFLGKQRSQYLAAAGEGLYVLAGSMVSPTLWRMRDQLKKELPKARWLSWEAVSEDNLDAGAQLAFGQQVVSHVDLSQANIVVTIGGDPLGLDSDLLRHARGFASRRKPEKAGDAMNRLYTVESAWTVTGTNSDHRLRLKPSEVALFAVALAAELAKHGVALDPALVAALPKAPSTIDAKFVAAVADDLSQNRGKAAILVGREQPKEVHALVHALHGALGAMGTTVTYTQSRDPDRLLDRDGLAELKTALDSKAAKTLVVLGGNPAYDLPVDFGFAERVKASGAALVHLGLYRDETARSAALHIPRAHFLEAWNDVRGRDGLVSIVQPLIAPLYRGWSDIELVSYLVTGRRAKGYDLVRETWRGSVLAKYVPPTPPLPEPVIPAVPPPAGKGAGAVVKDAVKAAQTAQAQGKGALATGAAAAKAAVAAAGAAVVEQVAPAGSVPAVAAPAPDPEQGFALFFDRAWRKALHEGVMDGWSFPALTPSLNSAQIASVMPGLAALVPQAMEVQFLVDFKIYDGRFANNGWLQELPDPITKLVWDNAALLSMDTAKQLGVEKDDMVRITVRGKSVDAAVFVQPGMASGVVAIALGYGRQSAGHIAKGAGFNAYQIRHSDGLWFDAAQVQKLDTKYTDERDYWYGDTTHITGLVSTQDHFAMEGRPLVREATLTRFHKRPDFAQHAVHHKPLRAIWDEPAELKQGQQWGMAIDLSSCIGCGACTLACQAENNIPIVGKAQVRKGREMHWIRVDRYFSFGSTALGAQDLTDTSTEVTHQPVNCMQCENAPCENVCPVAATIHSSDGLNDMVYNRCVGTRYCANNCPWKVRRFNFLDFRRDVEFAAFGGETPEVAKLRFNPDVTVRSRGVMEKCTYCVQRVRGAQRDAKLKTGSDRIQDGAVVTACQQSCPADAISFGDILDPSSRVSQDKASKRNYAMLAELNAKPRTTYLARVRNPNPTLEPEKPEADHGGGHSSAAGAAHSQPQPGASH